MAFWKKFMKNERREISEIETSNPYVSAASVFHSSG